MVQEEPALYCLATFCTNIDLNTTANSGGKGMTK